MPVYIFSTDAEETARRWSIAIVDARMKAANNTVVRTNGRVSPGWSLAIKVPTPPGALGVMMSGVSSSVSDENSYATFGPSNVSLGSGALQMTYYATVLHSDTDTPVMDAGAGGNLLKVGEDRLRRLSCSTFGDEAPKDQAIDVPTMNMLNLNVKMKVAAFNSRWYITKSIEQFKVFQALMAAKYPLIKFPFIPGTAVIEDKKQGKTIPNPYVNIGAAEHGLTLEQQKMYMECYITELYSHHAMPYEKESLKFLEVRCCLTLLSLA